MAVVVGRLKKNASTGYGAKTASASIDIRDLWTRLPFLAEPTVKYFSQEQAELAFFEYGAAQEFSEIKCNVEGGKCFGQGVLSSNAREWLPRILGDITQSVTALTCPESVAGILLVNGEITIFSSTSGTDHFLYLETASEIVFSNHHAILGAFISGGASPRPESLAWMLHKFHTFEFEHHFEGIKRTTPGSRLVFSNNTIRTVPMQFSWDELTAPLPDAELPTLVNAVSDDLSGYILGSNCAKSLSLSGGKDSRAVVGLLGDDLYGRWVNFSTYGEVYAPDVMAAKDLVALLGLEDNHYISSPPLVARPSNLVPVLVNDLLTDAALTSLADIRQVSVRTSMLLGGHEFGTKDQPNRLRLDDFVSRERKFLQNSAFLSESGKDLLGGRLIAGMQESLYDVPVDKLEVAWKIRYRLPLLIGSILTSLNTTATEVHPFLDFRFLRIVLGSDPAFTRSQAFHYLLNRRISAPVENVPFANDSWPAELDDVLQRLGVVKRGEASYPYRFNEAFPSQSSFGRYNWRVELFKGMRPRVLEFLHDGDFERDLLDVQRMCKLVERDESTWSFNNFYQLGAVLKFCLINEVGTATLDSANRDYISRTVQDFIGAKGQSSTPDYVAMEERATTEALHRSQAAIRDMAKQLQAERDGGVPIVDRTQVFAVLEDQRISSSLLASLVPAIGKHGSLVELSSNDEPLVFSLKVGKDGKVTVSGYIFRETATRVLVGFRCGTEVETTGLAFSEDGFWYFYISEDLGTGYFQKTVEIPSLSGETVECFVQRWYSSGSVYLTDFS